MMRRTTAIIAALVAAVILAACGGGSSTASGNSGTPRGDAEAKAQLLTAAEMPTGWTYSAPGGNSKGKFCGISNNENFGLKELGTAQTGFAEDQLPAFTEQISIVGSNPAGAFHKASAQVDSCHSITVDKIHLSISPTSLSAVPTASLSGTWTATGMTKGVTFSIDLVLAVKGDEVVTFTLTDAPSPNPATLESLETTAMRNIP